MVDVFNDAQKTVPSGPKVTAVLGRAGTGKTVLLAKAVGTLQELGYDLIHPEFVYTSKRTAHTACFLAPTNKAASVLRHRGVPATTLHRVLYVPVYDPQYEEIITWLENPSPTSIPVSERIPKETLTQAQAFYSSTPSVPGALTAAGLRGTDFISGWKRREETLSLGLIDEASMLDEKQFEDLKAVFTTLILFGDPAQLAPVTAQKGEMVFKRVAKAHTKTLSHIHRQVANSPILQLADMLQEDVTFEDFSTAVHRLSQDHADIEIAPRVNADIAKTSPVLVWRNATRIKLIGAFRKAFEITNTDLRAGEPLICDGIELPVKHRNKRFDLEARGLVKGAQVVYKGQGSKPTFAKIDVLGLDEPAVSVAAIIHIEHPDVDEPFIPSAAKMGVRFVHGAACTVHKAQGSQWPVIQVFAPDLRAAAFSNREENGIALWRRLAYVAITRAQEKLIWVTAPRMSRPKNHI